MRKFRFFVFLIVFLFMFSYSPLISPSATAEISAEAYVLIEASSKTILDSGAPHKKMEPASTTKILTALVAIENGDLSSVFKVSKNAAEVEGSQLGIEAGDEITLDDLLHILLMKSGNDAAVTIAENIAGSVDAFAEMMNERAEKIGCEDSHFTNPHGLSDENHYTSAYDLALIAAEALKNDTFSEIVSKKQHTLSYKNLSISNSNRLLKMNDYFCGVKTGFTKAAGRCLVSSAIQDGVTLIAVTLNDANDWDDHLLLMERGFERVEKKLLWKAGEYKTEISLLNGERKAVYSNEKDIYGVIIDGGEVKYDISVNMYPVIFAPAEASSYGGYLSVSCEGREIDRIPLILKERVEANDVPGNFKLFLYNLGKLLKMLL